jgi:YHS domain-containing protein
MKASLSFYIGSSNYDTIFSPQTKTLGSQVSGESAPAPASFSATAGGKTYYFNSQAELDSFKKDAGIK